MSGNPINLHGTAIRINRIGILCVGASGSGKSELAFSLIEEARRCGASAALIADDQVFLTFDRDTIVANRPEATAGLIELRGTGILAVDSEPSVTLNVAVTREMAKGNERLPPTGERYQISPTQSLPLVRIAPHSLTPFAKFSAFVAHLCQHGTFDASGT